MELTQMWDTISHSDVQAARQQLRKRREKMIRRQAEELAALDRDELEIQNLDQLVGAFLQRFILANDALVFELSGNAQKNVDDDTRAHMAAGISLLITQAQKLKLQELGIAEEQIRMMKPSEAHRILGLAS